MKCLHPAKATLFLCIGLIPVAATAQQIPGAELRGFLDEVVIMACEDDGEFFLLGIHQDKSGEIFVLSDVEIETMDFKPAGDAIVGTSKDEVLIIHEDKITVVSRKENFTLPCQRVGQDIKDITEAYLLLKQVPPRPLQDQ